MPSLIWSLFSIILTIPHIIGTATNPPTTTLTQDLIMDTFPSAAPTIPSITIDKVAAIKGNGRPQMMIFYKPSCKHRHFAPKQKSERWCHGYLNCTSNRRPLVNGAFHFEVSLRLKVDCINLSVNRHQYWSCNSHGPGN